MRCLGGNRGAKTVRDIVQVSTGEGLGPLAACPLRGRCREKAGELLNRMVNRWDPNRETRQHVPPSLAYTMTAMSSVTEVMLRYALVPL